MSQQPGNPAEGLEAARIPRAAWVALYLTSAGQAMAILQSSVLNIAFPSIEASFSDTPRSTLAWAITGYGIASAALLLLAGRLADIYGRRRIFMVGIMAFSVASLGCGLAPSPGWLIGARLVQAIGGSFMVPTSLSLMLPLFPASRRALAVGIWGAIGAVAGAAGPPIGAAIIELADWRWVFFINVPIGLVIVLLGRAVLPEVKGERSDVRIDLLGIPVGTAGVALLTLGLLQGSSWGWLDWRVVACFVATPLLIAALVRRSATHPEPLLDLSLFAHRRFNVASGAVLTFNLGVSAAWFSAPVYFQTVWGWSALEAGLGVIPSPIALLVLSRWAGGIADRGHLRLGIIGGMSAAAVALLGIGLSLTEDPNYWTAYFPFALLYGAGLAFAWSMLTGAALVGIDERLYGAANGASLTARTVGSALGVALVIAIAGGVGDVGHGDWEPVWLAIAGTFSVSAAGFALLYPRRFSATASST